jgi:plasmid stabilization system protein ParE
MSSSRVEFDPAAVEEGKVAHEWYQLRIPRIAAAFMEELDVAVEKIVEAPRRWPSYLRGTRRYLLRRFPNMVIYGETEAGIQILAVAHARRRPGYWKDRIT